MNLIGQVVKISSEFFDDAGDHEYFDCGVLRPAEPKIVNDFDEHDACYVVKRVLDDQEFVVCSDHFLKQETPRYQHDCNCCVFLGRFFNIANLSQYDLYFHERGEDSELVARFGDEPSYNLAVDVNEAEYRAEKYQTEKSPVGVAYTRAKERGLI